MATSSDDEQDSHHPQSSSTYSNFTNTFDDAFSDTDDNDVSFEFSPAAIRAELAKSLNGSSSRVDWRPDDDIGDLAARIGFADPHASEPPWKLDRANDHQLSPPTQQPPSSGSQSPSLSHSEALDDVNLTTEFSSISLGSPHPDDHREEPHEESHEEPHEEVHDEEQHSGEEEHEGQYASYPAVQIDVSENRPVTTVLRSDTPTSDSARTHTPAHERPSTDTAATVPLPVTPQSGNSTASTSSLPSSQAVTTPSSSHAQQASASHPSFFKHRTSRSVGPSMLDKVVSKTRPTWLPPKPRKEDKKHMADWEAMMKRSRVAVCFDFEEKRRKALQERRLERERRIEDSLVHWEREILPNWKVVLNNSALRRLWWQGIPSKLRATMWQNAVGNELVLSKESYKTCLARANRALSAGSFPTTVLGLIDDDIKGTLPSLHLFKPGTGPLYQDLKDMLCAWVVSRSDEGLGYVPGIAKIAGMILLNMDPPQGFVLMRNLLERHCLRSFYGGLASKDDVEAYYRIFDTLLADGMPKIYFNFKQHQVSPAAYLPDWLIPLFLDHLPFEACARLWDILLLEGDSFLFRASLGILAVLEPRLFFPEKRELLELLKGENKAALEVAKRDGLQLEGAAKYEIYGVDEETLWERLDSMEDWWRESTWTRLIQRELPDL
ncbi:hypothetical protein NM688_g615 [Phlebia brevispora]|uniref:Uncharacterized protein n=1 Tax=Phlebia brevispora TaxID=194682 RepID=A0ACC1TDZ8_9APHY|nr:hypothetical protein NM688_g615 [Phlebia brevispora]